MFKDKKVLPIGFNQNTLSLIEKYSTEFKISKAEVVRRLIDYSFADQTIFLHQILSQKKRLK